MDGAHQLIQSHGGPGELLAGVSPRQREQTLHEARHPLGLVDYVLQGFLHDRLAHRFTALQQLQVASNRGQRCAQLVGSVGDEPSLGGKGALEPGHHTVEGIDQAADLIPRVHGIEPGIESSGKADPAGRLGDAANRTQGHAGQEPGHDHGDDQERSSRAEERVTQKAEGVLHRLLGAGHLDVADELVFGDQRHREQPYVLAVEQNGFEKAVALLGFPQARGTVG